MGTLHRLPTRRSPKVGYCMECGVEMPWPSVHAWPETCPTGCTPVVLTTWRPQPEVLTITDGAGRIVGTIEQ